MYDLGFWSNLVSTVIGAAVGALLAFELERRRRNDEQRHSEVGRCHQLFCLLVNRMNVLQDFHEQSFLDFEKAHKGRAPKWHEVGALDGAPGRTDEIPIGDYTFLIDGRKHKSDAASLLRKVQLSTINTNSLFDRIARRNQLWHEREYLKPQAEMQIGPDGAQARVQVIALDRSLEESTTWMRKDFEEEIAALKTIFVVFYQVMGEHYPDEKILHAKPIDGGPPLGLAGGAASENATGT